MGVVAHLLEAEAAAERFEVLIVRVRQRLVHVDLPAAQIDRRVLGHDAFAQGRKGHRNFDRGAGLRAAGKSQLLVDHGQDAAVAGIDGNHRAIHVAQGIQRGFAHDRIFARGYIARRRIRGVGAGREALTIKMNSSMAPYRNAARAAGALLAFGRAGTDRTAVPGGRHAPLRIRVLLDPVIGARLMTGGKRGRKRSQREP